MKILHLADLHIGKKVNEFSMIEDQEYIFTKILNIIDDNGVDAVLIAGDVYDKTVPTAEAVQLFDSFLTKLANRNLPVFVISGNHDSAERIGFGSQLMSKSNVYMSHVFDGKLQKVTLTDKYGKLNVFMLPFVKPIHVRKFYEDSVLSDEDEEKNEIKSYNDAVKVIMDRADVNEDERNVLVAHQFVTGAVRCDSEDISVGGIDNVDVNNFDAFDYVALGHIHGPQHIGRETARYSGTLLKYSFSEMEHKKSALIVDIKDKGNIEIIKIPIEPLRDMKEIKGTYLEITDKKFYKDKKLDDYYKIILTDEDDVPEAISKLRVIYPNVMRLDYDNKRTQASKELTNIQSVEKREPIGVFSEFFESRNNQEMTDEQKEFMQEVINSIWEVK